MLANVDAWGSLSLRAHGQCTAANRSELVQTTRSSCFERWLASGSQNFVLMKMCLCMLHKHPRMSTSSSFFFFKANHWVFLVFLSFFMALLGLRFCVRAFSSCSKWGPLFIAVRGPLTIVASLVAEQGSRRAGSVVVAHGPSCSASCGIFPDQG